MATAKTKTTTKKAAPKKAASAKTAKTSKAKAATTERRLSALDAAAKLLGEVNAPLSAKEMIETMAARGYWTSPGGKTPEATLYAAIAREIQKKGTDARFKKHDRGRFVFNPAATKSAEKAAGKKASAKKAATTSKAAPVNGTPGPKAASDLFKI